jgi:hypothetical protein
MEATAPTDLLVECESAASVDVLARQPLALRHRVSSHPLVTLDALTSLADDLPAAWASVVPADLPLVHPAPLQTLGVAASDVLRALDTAGLRVTLSHLEHVPRFRPLLDACLAFSAVAAAREGPLRSVEANVFAGAPRSTVPAHLDRYHNVVLQLEGTKELTVGWFADAIEHARAVETRFDAARPNPDCLPTVTRVFRLGPGDGVYIPPYTFHWVQAGDGASVAFSFGFNTFATERAELVHRANAKLRRLGVRPRPAGASPMRDGAKAALFETARRVRGRLRDRTAHTS